MQNRSKSLDSGVKGKSKEIRFELGEPTGVNYPSTRSEWNGYSQQIPPQVCPLFFSN